MSPLSSLHRVLVAGLAASALMTVAWAQPVPTGAPIRIAMIEGFSGPSANAGEAVFRNLVWATERVNARGGVKLPGGPRPLVIERFDSKGQVEAALSALHAVNDRGIAIVAQGNSSPIASALIKAIARHNEREPQRQMVFLNYSAVDPALTNHDCSYWHFRFDAHADMRLKALMGVIQEDKALKSVYLIGQDHSVGQNVLRAAREQLAAQRPDVTIVGDELHPVARARDFVPYATKIKASGAQAVFTVNWGNDLALLVKAAREVGFEGRFYTFYGNALGAPAAMGEAGIGRVVAVADWFPNVPTPESEAFYRGFRQRFPSPADDYVHMRMQLMIESLAQAIERAGKVEAGAIAAQLEKADVSLAGQRARMRAGDHQFQQSLAVAVMDRQGAPGVKFDVEGSGYGFRVIRQLTPEQAELPHTCRMVRP